MRHYIGISTSRVSIFKLGWVFATADAVVAGEVGSICSLTALNPQLYGDTRPGVVMQVLRGGVRPLTLAHFIRVAHICHASTLSKKLRPSTHGIFGVKTWLSAFGTVYPS